MFIDSLKPSLHLHVSLLQTELAIPVQGSVPVQVTAETTEERLNYYVYIIRIKYIIRISFFSLRYKFHYERHQESLYLTVIHELVSLLFVLLSYNNIKNNKPS